MAYKVVYFMTNNAAAMHAYSGQEVVSATCSFLSQASPSLLEILLCSCSAVKIGPNLALLQQR